MLPWKGSRQDLTKGKQPWAILEAVNSSTKTIILENNKSVIDIKGGTGIGLPTAFRIERSFFSHPSLIIEVPQVFVDLEEKIGKMKLLPEHTIEYGSLNYKFYMIKKTSRDMTWLSAKYKGFSLIELGTFGEMYSAYSIEKEKMVALKLLGSVNTANDKKPIDRLNWEKAQKKFQAEYKVLTNLNSDNIIKLTDWFCNEQTIYMELEHCPGGNLFTRLNLKKILRESFVKLTFYQILSALSYLHERGFVHRDIKPHSIFLMSTEKHSIAKIGNFNLTCHRSTEVFSAGTFIYCAPEVHKTIFDNNLHSFSSSIDVWSIGVTLYYVLSNDYPFGKYEERKTYHSNAANKIFNFNQMVWTHRSLQARDIITSIFMADNDNRPSCQVLLRSKWFQEDLKLKSDLRDLTVKV